MIAALVSFSLILIAGLVITLVAALRAKDGLEDRWGFHFVSTDSAGGSEESDAPAPSARRPEFGVLSLE